VAFIRETGNVYKILVENPNGLEWDLGQLDIGGMIIFK
jgi:hypothetical protein